MHIYPPLPPHPSSSPLVSVSFTLASMGDGVSYPVLFADEDAETLLGHEHETIEIESDDSYHNKYQDENDSTVDF